MQENIDESLIFQSTLPARGATELRQRTACSPLHFNPRSPHGERRMTLSISSRRQRLFQSTLPARGATHKIAQKALEGTDFNPRSPHGERLNRC